MANWVSKAVGNSPGTLHRALHVPMGTKIPAAKLDAAAKRNDKVGQEARLAKTMRGFHHKKK